MSIESTRCADMSIYPQEIDRSEVYVDFIDRFVTCVEKTPNFDKRSRDGDIATVCPVPLKLLAVIGRRWANGSRCTLTIDSECRVVSLAACGGSGDQLVNAQDTNMLMGAIVRLDISGGSHYGIRTGNPFETNPVCAGGSGMSSCPEICAWGLRNPWRFSFDSSPRNCGPPMLGKARGRRSMSSLLVAITVGMSVKVRAALAQPQVAKTLS